MNHSKDMIYDLIIVGTGPAGLTASLYAARYKLKTLAIGNFPGGLANEAHKICNFPTEVEITGMDLSEKMAKTALSQGALIENDEVVGIKNEGDYFSVTTRSKTYKTKTVLLATGMQHRKLGLEREKEFVGRGISYCATCDGMFNKDKIVGVVGGNDSALTASLYLAEIAKKVFLIYRGSDLRGEPVWIEKVQKNKKIEVLLETNIKKFVGDAFLDGVILDRPYNNGDTLPLQSLFIEIGSEPKHPEYIFELGVALDEKQFIKVTQDQKTSVPGIWSAGDITNASNGFRQIITACSEGAIAAENIFHYLQ